MRFRGQIVVDKFTRRGGVLVPVGTVRGHNQFLDVGIEHIWDLIVGNSGAVFNNAMAQIGIGDGGMKVTAIQTDLQGAQRAYRPMDPMFPSRFNQKTYTFKATFGYGEANFTWREFVVKHVGGICLDRGVSSMGTKTRDDVWTAAIPLSIA